MAVHSHKLERLEALYARVPALACGLSCGRFCTTGPIPIGQVEWERIVERLGYEAHGNTTTWVCPFYDGRLCTIHDIRPLICRLWGATEGMECPHGCTPERLLSRAEGQALLQELYAISGQSYWVWTKEDYERMASTIRLHAADRISLLQVLNMAGTFAQEGNIATLRQLRALQEALSFSDEDHVALDLRAQARCANGHPPVTFPASTSEFGVCPVCKAPLVRSSWQWTASKDVGVDIPMGPVARQIVADAFKQLEARGKLQMVWLDLYEEFVPEEPEQDIETPEQGA